MDTINGDTITVSFPIDQLKQLKAFAARFHVTPEELVRISVEELLSRPEEDFQKALDYVLKKNAELYHRLA